ncbi:GNAT family N-acetyltransferase [Streptomyces sp. ISL-11]|uniref:GNAT family N-acetyltransferase n=1 Tax=Streptomyces sp. ISL-11 TaxID=2819174 RepID=UPI001BE80187|nr:GNAT family N-acetyltransferase [Streptomyces sp. ISL-11]MBT2383679.1 GNAT family N-acetyltransferase [Streptomyces sp. ISL-11]
MIEHTTDTPSVGPAWSVAPRSVRSADAAALLREYLTDVADRWYVLHEGRNVTPEEIERHLAEDPSDDLAPPDGVFLVARHGDGPAGGCVGLRRLDARTAELKRMYVRAAHRGLGGAPALLAAAEAAARAWGAGRIVLDTRKDLVEAIALYTRHGFAPVPRYNTAEDNPYAEVWLAKELRP